MYTISDFRHGTATMGTLPPLPSCRAVKARSNGAASRLRFSSVSLDHYVKTHTQEISWNNQGVSLRGVDVIYHGD